MIFYTLLNFNNMNQVIFISDTPKGRVYKFSTKEDERKFNLLWQMGFIAEIQDNKINMEYRGYTIERGQHPWTGEPEYMFYPTSEGISHDGDYDGEQYRYCGNCAWASDLDDAKDMIDEIVEPLHK